MTAIVNRTVHGSAHHDDYLQEGAVALIQAVDRYNPDQGSLASYAVPRIKGAVLDLLATGGVATTTPH